MLGKGNATWARDGGGQEGVGGGWKDRNPWLMMHSMAVGKGDAMRSWGVALGRRSSPLMRSMRMHTYNRNPLHGYVRLGHVAVFQEMTGHGKPTLKEHNGHLLSHKHSTKGAHQERHRRTLFSDKSINLRRGHDNHPHLCPSERNPWLHSTNPIRHGRRN